MNSKLIAYQLQRVTFKYQDHRLYREGKKPVLKIDGQRYRLDVICYGLARNIPLQSIKRKKYISNCGYLNCVNPTHLELFTKERLFMPHHPMPAPPSPILDPSSVPRHPCYETKTKHEKERQLRAEVSKYFTRIDQIRAERRAEYGYNTQLKLARLKPRDTPLTPGEYNIRVEENKLHEDFLKRLAEREWVVQQILVRLKLTEKEAIPIWHRAEWIRKSEEARAAARKNKANGIVRTDEEKKEHKRMLRAERARQVKREKAAEPKVRQIRQPITPERTKEQVIAEREEKKRLIARERRAAIQQAYEKSHISR